VRARLRTLLLVSSVAAPVAATGAWAAAGALESSSSRSPRPPETDPAAPTANPRSGPASARALRRGKGPSKPKHRVIGTGTCRASYYWTPQSTASGERFDPDGFTAAHRTLPMHSRVRVTNRDNGESVIVRINDRGPYVAGRCLDLSRAAMRAVGGIGAGVIPVRYQVLAGS